MSTDIAGLRRERAKASDKASELVAKAKGRSMTADEKREFDEAEASVHALDGQISAAETQERSRAATSISRSDASEIAKLCADGGVPTMASTLLAEGVSVAEAKTRIGAAGQIKDLVALARKTSDAIPEGMAEEMIASGRTVDQTRAALFDKLVAKQEQTSVRSHVAPGAGETSASPTATTGNMARQLKSLGITTKEA